MHARVAVPCPAEVTAPLEHLLQKLEVQALKPPPLVGSHGHVGVQGQLVRAIELAEPPHPLQGAGRVGLDKHAHKDPHQLARHAHPPTPRRRARLVSYAPIHASSNSPCFTRRRTDDWVSCSASYVTESVVREGPLIFRGVVSAVAPLALPQSRKGGSRSQRTRHSAENQKWGIQERFRGVHGGKFGKRRQYQFRFVELTCGALGTDQNSTPYIIRWEG